MKQTSSLYLIAILILLSLQFSCTSYSSSKPNTIDNLLAQLSGNYVGVTTNAEGETSPMRDIRVRVNAPGISPYVIYWEVRTGVEQKLYRQRLLTYSFDELSGEIIQQTWSLNENQNWPNEIDTESFVSLKQSEINSQLGELCVNKWTPHEQGWRSYLDPKTCRIWSERRQRYRRIEGESIVSNESLKQAERGYSDDGMIQEFGTTQGEFHTLIRQ